MTSILTGDIVHSQKIAPALWLDLLKIEFAYYGSSPSNWEIFRGDSFQLEVANPLEALAAAIKIKATIKCIKDLDVRIAIGIGTKTYCANEITQSNGSAFNYSGEQFDRLKREKRNLAIASEWTDFDRDLSLLIRLALMEMDNWTTSSAEIVKTVLEYPDKSQYELGKMLGIKQNAVSSRLKRAHFDEISELINLYKIKLNSYLR